MVQQDLYVCRPYNVVEREKTTGDARARESSSESLIPLSPLIPNATMSQTIHARDGKFEQEGTEGSIQSASDESPSGDTDVYGVISQAVAEQLGEYFTITVTDDEDAVQAERTGETKNFGKYETPGRSVYGLGISKQLLENVFGEVPETVGLSFASSSQEDYEDAMEELEESQEEEAAALVGGSGSDDSEDEEAVEISDEELNIVDGE